MNPRPALLVLSLLLAVPAPAAVVEVGKIIEDFTTLDYADLTLPSSQVTTGVWDSVHHQARPHAYANGAVETTRPIDFGDGSDGDVNSSAGYAFNTDTHPNGYSFRSFAVTGGAITVTGSHPLIVRSLTTLQIASTVDVSGLNGDPGSATGAAIIGKSARTCLAKGGNGGGASLPAGLDGGDAIKSDGTPEGNGLYGQGQTGANTNLVDGQGAITGPASNDFENAANFICGSSGPGGGGYSDAAASFASGGAGGAGGGIVRLIAVGDVSVASVNARGGNGGNGVVVAAGPKCSGNGSGGNGGVIWMQTLGTLTTSVGPDVTAGTSGTTTCWIGSGQSFFDGFKRGDTASGGGRPAWATTAGSYDTDIVPPLLQSTVQSKAYPLGVLNAGFSAPTIVSSGTVDVTYAGSADGTNFGAFVSDLTSLSDQGYRYLKFRAKFTNPGAAGAPPTLSQVTLKYEELGLSKIALALSAGCGTLAKQGPSRPESGPIGALLTIFWFAGFYALTRISKKMSRT